MSNIIDISGKITNELPIVKISDEILATVNNRKSVIMTMQLLVNEQQKKATESGEGYDEFAFMGKILAMLVSPTVVKAIEKIDLPLPEYKLVYNAVMAAATGQTLEDMEAAEKRFQQ